jgi:uncharacterized membrane protein
MRTILWPVTAVLVFVLGVLLFAFALTATLLSTFASAVASGIIQLLITQRSPLLIKLTSFLGTELSDKDIQGKHNESTR